MKCFFDILATIALKELPFKNSSASHRVLPENCGNSTLTACLACSGCIIFPPVLCTHFSNANTSFKFLPF